VKLVSIGWPFWTFKSGLQLSGTWVVAKIAHGRGAKGHGLVAAAKHEATEQSESYSQDVARAGGVVSRGGGAA
jgi:hypothetical protein